VGQWYVVIKTIKGHRYRYRQRTWREGQHVRTESLYLGPADGGPRARQSWAGNLCGNGKKTPMLQPGEQELLDSLFDEAHYGLWQHGWRPRAPYRPDAAKFVPDKALIKIGTRMGVGMRSRPFPVEWGEQLEEAGGWYDEKHNAIQIPDPTRFRYRGRNTPEQLFTNILLHELAHATRPRLQRPQRSYAEEEVVAELTANLVARRIGKELRDLSRSTSYIIGWWRECADEEDARAFAIREATRAAAYLTEMYASDDASPQSRSI
jgi:hypothetical protein